MNDVIGELLRASLLEQVGDDERRVDYLRRAAGVLAGRLADQERGLLPAALLVAVDGNSDVEGPMLQMTREALLGEWETLRNAYPAEPAELYRAVLLDAAASASARDENTLAAGWYTLRTIAEQLPAARWQPVLKMLFSEWDGTVGPAAEQAWVVDRSRKRPAKKATSPSPAQIEIESAASKRATRIVSNGNWQTQAQQLMQQLPSLVEELVGDAQDAATEALRLSSEQSEKALVPVFDELRSRVEARLRASRAVELRSELLWWHVTGYSSRRRTRYSELSPEQATIAAALDVHHLVDGLCPVSVEHVLHDTVEAGAKGEVTLDSLADCRWNSDLAHDIDPAEGTILHAVARAQNTPLFEHAAPLPSGRAAVLLFRDLQAASLLARRTP